MELSALEDGDICLPLDERQGIAYEVRGMNDLGCHESSHEPGGHEEVKLALFSPEIQQFQARE